MTTRPAPAAPSCDRQSPAGGGRLQSLRHELRGTLDALRSALDVLKRANPCSEQDLRALTVADRYATRLGLLLDEWCCASAPSLGTATVFTGTDVHLRLPAARRRAALVDRDARRIAAWRSVLEESLGYEVLCAVEACAALRLIISQRPAVVLVDGGLAGDAAFALSRSSRAAGYAGRMLAICPHAGEPWRRLAMQAG